MSLRFISPAKNQDGGRLLRGMLRTDNTAVGSKYIVLAHPMVPLSFYWTRKGKIGMSRSFDPDRE